MTTTLTHLAHRYARFALTTMAIIGMPSLVRGQAAPPSVDIASLTTALDSSELSTRAAAVAALATVPPTTLPQATKLRLIALLEREATTTTSSRTDEGEDSERGLYLVQLVRAVVRLQHPASLRGLTMLGLQTSRAAQQFVASQGDTAVQLLVLAERADSNNAAVATETRGLMLGEYASRLSSGARSAVRASLLAAASTDAFAFAHGAESARLLEATPVLAALAAQVTTDLGRAILGDAAVRMAARRDQATTTQVLDGLTESLTALCLGARASRLQTCQTMVNTARLVFDHLRDARPALARQALRTLAAAATDAARRGIITATEGTMIAGTATYLVGRI